MTETEDEDWGYEYTVLSQADGFFSDRFDASTLMSRLNDLSTNGWRVVSSSAIDFTGLKGLGQSRHEMFVILERKRKAPPVFVGMARKKAPAAVYDDDGTEGYDPSRIPEDRFYRRAGNVSKALKVDGLVTDEQLDLARAEFAKRGGHLVDHLFAFGFVNEAALRKKAYLFG